VTLTWLVAAGILAQAVLAGQGWFLDQSRFALHGSVGHGVLLLAAVAATLCWIAAPRWVAVLATVIIVGLVGQTGLGYLGRRGGAAFASAAHVPLGVALLGAAVAVALGATLARPRTTSSAVADAAATSPSD
jgi:hypothetical protein